MLLWLNHFILAEERKRQLEYFTWLLYLRKQFKRNHGVKVPDGFQSTEEINIDPLTDEKIRVYYNPDTGEHFYKKEK